MKTNSILRSAKLRRKNVDNQRQIASEQPFYEPKQTKCSNKSQNPANITTNISPITKNKPYEDNEELE